MKVWIVTISPRDGYEILAVFDSVEKAKIFARAMEGQPYGEPYVGVDGKSHQQTYKSDWFNFQRWDVE